MPLCRLCDALEFPALLYERTLTRREVPIGVSQRAYSPKGNENIRSRGDGSGYNFQPGYEDLSEVLSFVQSDDLNSSRQELGPAIALLDRKDNCTLCNIIYLAFKAQNLELTGEYEIVIARFCSSRAIGSDREKYLDRIGVYWTPPRALPLIGPFLPHQQDEALLQQAQCVVELQRYAVEGCLTQGDIFAPENNEILSSVSFSGRRMDPELADMSLLARWIRLCDENHKTSCRQPVGVLSESSQSLTSLLVIDVEMMCIVDAPMRCHFVALSYCWGLAVTLKHLRANCMVLRVPGSLEISNLPATIGDAICLVKGVGERYLWIDALCIIQDDPISQQVQLAQMGRIYSLAAFTIVAAFGKDANAGLPGVRAGNKRFSQETVHVGGSTFLTAVSGGISGAIGNSTWYSRAWTMQERVLSKKCLVFTEEQVYWSCWGATWLEETNLETAPRVEFHQNPLARDWWTLSFASAAKNYYTLYDDLVSNYSKRQLSFQSDVINAFSGLAEILSSIRNESFHWGLPESRFDRCLSWISHGGGKRNNAACPLYRDGQLLGQVLIPSWSWAAWFGQGRNYVSFEGYTARLDGEPEIIFYRQDAGGAIHEIVDKTGVSADPEFARANVWLEKSNLKELRMQWKGQPQTISEVSENIGNEPADTGHLHFWTSTAQLYICRTRSNSSGSITYSILRDESMMLEMEHTRTWFIHMDTTDHIPFQDLNNLKNIPKFFLDQVDDSDEDTSNDIIIKDIVVIGRGLWEASPRPEHCVTRLTALIVEWEDDIAYRIGMVSMYERNWVAVGNRIWKRVKMG